MDNINEIVAKNLIALRKSQHLTQAELSAKLNYSDKSISKWENGEAVPSIEILAKIGEVFHVGVEYFIKEHRSAKPKFLVPTEKNKIIITLLAVSIVWLVALSLYTVFMLSTRLNLWTIFVWAVPVSIAIITVFSFLWATRGLKYFAISVLIWTSVSAVYFQFLQANLWMFFVVAIPLQLAVILWAFRAKRPAEKQEKEQ